MRNEVGGADVACAGEETLRSKERVIGLKLGEFDLLSARVHRYYYYYCRDHDPLRAGGEDRRCRERNVRSDTLDAFAFD